MRSTFVPRLALALALAAPVVSAREEPALSIDGAPVSFEEFAAWFIAFHGEAYVQDYVDLRLLERAAAAEGVEVTREQVAARVDAQIAARVTGAFEGDVEAWRLELERLGMTPEENRARLELATYGELLSSGLAARRRSIDAQAVRALWEQRHGPGGRDVELRWIHLAVRPPSAPPGTPRAEIEELTRAARAAVEAEALELRARVVAGADFETVARERNDDPGARASGGRLPEEFEQRPDAVEVRAALRALAVGEVSQPMYGRGGYDLYWIASERHTPLESVAAELELELRSAPTSAAEASALLAELRAGLELEILPEFARPVAGRADDPASWRMERPVLRIGGEFVPRGVYAGWLCAARGKPYVRTFAEMRIVEQAAAAAGFQVASADVDRRVYDDLEHSIEINFEGDREQWLAQIAASDLNEASWLRMARTRARTDLLTEGLILAGRTIEEPELRRAWEDRYGPGGRTPDVRRLMRTLPNPEKGTVTTREELDRYTARARTEMVALLTSLRERVAAGEDFATIVALYSQEPETRERGGRPAGRFELHSWSQEVQDAINALAPGAVTEPIEIGLEYYLFQLVGVRTVPFEEVREELARELRETRPSMVDVRSFVNAMYMKHDVRALPGLVSRRPGPAK